jgi:regulator of nonsense transcripts 1
VPVVFVQCSAEEDYGGASKKNSGQAIVVQEIVKRLRTPRDRRESRVEDEAIIKELSITGLTPYSKQVRELKNVLPDGVGTYTIDSFQGRESDIIVFSTVRCNASRDIGFVDDARRLNVAWTRAKLALIIVGDRSTMSENALWKRAIESCVEVAMNIPNADEPTSS